MNIILEIATHEAMDLAFEIMATTPEERYSLMVRFAPVGLDAEPMVKEMLEHARATDDEDAIVAITGQMELLILTASGAQATRFENEQGAIELREVFDAAMMQLVEHGPTNAHRAYAGLRMVQNVCSSPNGPLARLDPLCAKFAEPEVSPALPATELHRTSRQSQRATKLSMASVQEHVERMGPAMIQTQVLEASIDLALAIYQVVEPATLSSARSIENRP